MSEKNLDNDDNDDEKKYDDGADAPAVGHSTASAQFVDFDKSEQFIKSAALIYEYLYEIYIANRKTFFTTKFDLYSKFFRKFQPGEPYSRSSADAEAIKNTVVKAYDLQKCLIYPTLFNKSSDNFHVPQSKVGGVLYAILQNTLADYKSKAIFDTGKLKATESSIYAASNVYFAISTPRTYDEIEKLKTAGRIAIHLSTTPDQFWNSPLLFNIIDVLLHHECVKALKVREVNEFGRGDSLLVYCSVPGKTAWKILQKDITHVLPLSVREDYPMPFATQLDVGINANIPIFFISGKKVNKSSFTSGLAEIGRQALHRSVLDDRFGNYPPNDSTPRVDAARMKNIRLFQRHLADLFRENGIYIDRAGALHQPAAPKAK